MPEWRLTRIAGEFCVTWNDSEGTRRRYRLGTTDKAEATRRATSRFATLTRPRGTTVSDLWTAYRIEKDGKAVLVTMIYTWKALEKRFGRMEATDITVEDCREHTKSRRANGIKDGTIHNELGHLRTVLNWAEKKGTIPRAPHIERPPKPDPRDRYLTQHEVKRIIEAAHTPHIALAVRLLIATGARVTAALQLTWDRVDFTRRTINLRNPFDRTQRKGRAVVPMSEAMQAVLREAKEGALTPYVIEWAGKPVRSIKTGLNNASKAAGISDVSPHVLRHSAAVWLAEAGHSMYEISQFMGHSDIKITIRIYARYSPTHLRKLADTLDVV